MIKMFINDIKGTKKSIIFWHSIGILTQLGIGLFIDWAWVGIIQMLLFFALCIGFLGRSFDEMEKIGPQSLAYYVLILIGTICYGIYLVFKKPVMFIVNAIKNFNKILDNKNG